MKRLLFLLFATLLFAKTHTVQIVPYAIYHIKAAASGWVVQSDFEKESKIVKDAVLVHIDDAIDRKNLKTLQEKLKNIKNIIAITKQNIENAKQVFALKKENYDRIKDLKTKSKIEKNLRFAEYLTAKSTLLSLQEKLQNLLMQRNDIALQITKTKDLIEKKNPKISGYVYKVYPKKGDFVNFGAPLVDVADTTKAKAVLYLTPKELENIEAKKIYIDGKPTNLRFFKLFALPDSDYITQYKAEIILPTPKIFGKFIKVEIR